MQYEMKREKDGGIAVPEIVFERLPEAEEDFVRVALYCVQTGQTDPAAISRALRLKNAEKAQRALAFWKGAGLLQRVAEIPEESAPAQVTRARMTTPEITAAAAGDPAVATLVQECQRLMGGVITQADTNVFVSLYLVDGLPVELILLGVVHFATGKERRSARYIEKALLGWQRDGIDTYAAAERYLKQEEQRMKWAQHMAALLNLPDAKFSKGERLKIASWYEDMRFDDGMVAEAVSWAGDKKSVAYVHGILRKWYAAGYKTVRDVLNANTGLMHNVQTTNPEGTRPILNGGMKRAPKFRHGGELT